MSRQRPPSADRALLRVLAIGVLALSMLAAVSEASAAVGEAGAAGPEVRAAVPRPAPVSVATVPEVRAAVARPAAASVAAGPAVPTTCGDGRVEADLDGSGDTAVVSGRAVECHSTAGTRGRGGARPYLTYEIVCSTDRAAAAAGLCSTTPCAAGTHFAFRTLHQPDGRTEPAGFSCVRLDRAAAAPGLTAADVFAAVRAVELPAGAIRAVPSGRGLANLPSDLWLVGDELAPVDLRLAGSTIHAEFQPVAYRWSFGSGRASRAGRVVPASADPADRHGAAGAVFPGGGRFAVSVSTQWSATASLDGRFVGQVDGLVSTARLSYPVVELRTDLDG